MNAERAPISLLLLTMTPVVLGQGPPLWPHLTLIVSLKALSLNTVILGVKSSVYEFGEVQFSP